MKYIDKALECIGKLCTFLAGLLLCWMLIAMTVQVVSRYIFNTGFAWTEESTRYAMIWMVFVGAVVCTKEGMHVAVDAAEELLPKLAGILKFIQYILMMVYCAAVCSFAVRNLANAAKQTSPNMKISMFYLHLVFPVTMVLIALYTLRHLIALFRREKYGKGETEAADAIKQAETEMKGGAK